MTIKSIIGGKRYNSDTSTRVAAAGEGYRNDFHFWAEDLYLTPKGAWWIHGDGGAASKYSKTFNGTSCGDEAVFTLSDDEAREWLERHDHCAELETYFGATLEDA